MTDSIDLSGLIEAAALTLDFAFYDATWRIRSDDVIMVNHNWILAIASAESYGIRVFSRLLATGDSADLADWTVIDLGPLALTPSEAIAAKSRARRVDGLAPKLASQAKLSQ